ncbi:stalk domain-containing protein [Paenibacillus sp. OV219]|uniref:stalk domain-containing protein n=1 Tax=Paenibacillus sp. OV219 TaxID=1884377 RepID=UPI0008D09565|nr:stalk domain-containing protein [Paenibacillus sp. OV219]SEO05479.1 Copper amine oxidase N-terminal domain-containing protein [Paenibacillus sp. OV219]
MLMTGNWKMISSMLVLAAVTIAQGTSLHAAEAEQIPSLFLDGKPFTAPVIIENGISFVPMRPIFEAEGAKVVWDEAAHSITAKKDNSVITYKLGDQVAYKNQEKLELPAPGQIINGLTMVPLRFVSELLGNAVKWHAALHTITISSAHSFDTNVTYGVHLRTVPSGEDAATVVRMLPKAERIHVIREVDANWLEVQTEDNGIGFISAKPKYTDYSSQSLSAMQADAIIAFGGAYLGTHYEFGADSDQTNTFDCSSFVKHVFGEVLGIDLPRLSYDQAKEGTEVKLDELRKGDLLFFSARGLDIGHVAIYAGDGRILHTYSDKLGVHFETFEGQWKERFVTARRVID